ncbi:MAG: FAD-dependent oxidoreductase, partial [Chthonomonadales bacterium]
GDLMAKAGVKYTIGREANSQYNETIDGVQVRDKHQFEHQVDPYVREKDDQSGLLPGIDPTPLPAIGSGDSRIQAYTFRTCLTKEASNRIPFAKPAGYDRKQYILLERYLETGWSAVFDKFDTIRGNKVDNNNHGATSTDFIGQNYAWPEATYRVRERLFQQHLRYQQGFYYFLSTDPKVFEKLRSEMERWGLCRDEFQSTGGWPHQLYIREARRMVSEYVMTENNCRGKVVAYDPIGLGAYGMDSHNCRRFVDNGYVRNEGDVQAGGFPPYPISYRSIVPKRGDVDNLLVPVCLSATHIAYGSIRMEPVFMILGQSAAIAADLAIRNNLPLQDLKYSDLQTELEKHGQVTTWKPGK